MAERDGATVGETLKRASLRLTAAGVETARLDAELLLAHQLDTNREALLADPDWRMERAVGEEFEQLVARRVDREPLAYITGSQEFYGLDFLVDQRVLIPRPETETLVQVALATAARMGSRTIADVGTGSGAVAVVLAKHLQGVTIYGIDASAEALEVAEANVHKHGVEETVTLLPGSLLEPLEGAVDLIVANLPYVAEAEWEDLPREVARYEPPQALRGGPAGLEAIRELLVQASAYLSPKGAVCVEIAPHQADPMASLSKEHLPSHHLAVVKDLAGRARVALLAPPA
ncbi:MAG: peptide chain release factor N(5)-glutamine methyltransferase [Anaerolineae bacterium]